MPPFLASTRGRPFITILLCHLLWAFCYPPFNLGPLIFVLPAIMWQASFSLSPRKAFWYHFSAGLAYNIIMYFWLYNVMKVGPAVVILLGVLLLVVALSLFNGYLGWLAVRLQKKSYGWLVFTLLATGLEVVRTSGQMSFPWSHLAYTLGHYLPFIQISSLIGVFGVSALIYLANYLGAVFLYQKHYGALKFLVLVPALMLLYGVVELKLMPSGEFHSSADISLVQPSIEQTKKWDEGYFQSVMESTYGVMDEANLKNSDIIILAETAIPAFLSQRPEVYAEFKRRAMEYRSDLIVGSLDFKINNHPAKPYIFYNAAFLFSKDSLKGAEQYNKLYLVPFSERLPFDNIFPLLNYVNFGEGDFSSGTEIFLWGEKFKYSPSICYEVVYPGYIRQIVKKGAQLLINITNDGWFGRSPAPFQHANITKFRAIESGIPIARCSNAGISVFYDNRGRTLEKTSLFEKTVLRKKIDVTTRKTLYNIIGTPMEWGLLLFFAALNSFWFIGWLLGKILPALRRRNS